ncbi:MAG: helix-turn-helix transcriptional regulator [bacterium]|nr:helix-turn-helix transcriptional regulator [bacterium]
MTLFGSRLKQLRKDAHLTQTQVGEKVGVTKVSICCYENGTRLPSLDTLVDLANLFKVDVDYLLGNDTYVVADNDYEYSISMSKEELVFIKEIRKYNKLHKDIVADPKRIAELIYKKLK